MLTLSFKPFFLNYKPHDEFGCFSENDISVLTNVQNVIQTFTDL